MQNLFVPGAAVTTRGQNFSKEKSGGKILFRQNAPEEARTISLKQIRVGTFLGYFPNTPKTTTKKEGKVLFQDQERTRTFLTKKEGGKDFFEILHSHPLYQ